MHKYLLPWKSLLDLELHTFANKIYDVFINSFYSSQNFFDFLLVCFPSYLINAPARFWWFACKNSEEDSSKGVYITLAVLMRNTFGLLRRLIIRSSNNSASSCSSCKPWSSKISQFDDLFSVLILNHYVLRFQISVNNAFRI